MDSPTGRIAPGPPGQPLLGHLLAFRRDVLGLLLESRDRYGDVVRFRLGPQVIHLVAHPEAIKHVLVTRQHVYDKQTRSSAKIRATTGPGLLTSSGDFWLRQRRLTQPAFAPRRLAEFLGIMVEATETMLAHWHEPSASGMTIDVASEMMRLTCGIIARALFGVDVTAELPTIERSATVLMAHTWRRLERIIDVPTWWPTPGNLRFRRALRALDAVVDRIIDKRRRAGEGGTDLLSQIMQRTDEETGQRMSLAELRNEVVTLLLAGHETTANALTWLCHLLTQHPETAQRIRDEAASVLGERAPTADDLPRLRVLGMAFAEALRLYPPIWIMERRARENDVIAGYRISAGSSVVICPYVTHRHPDFWDDPERFDPERFAPERDANAAYLPFGLGQRRCLGADLATMEAQVIGALLLRRVRLEAIPGVVVAPLPGITLRVRGGLRLRVHPAAGR